MSPKFKIGGHVITYSLFLGVATCGALAFSEVYGVSEEEKLRVLREKYPAQIKQQEMQHKDIQEFFNKMKNGQNAELENKFDEILKAGKNASKRSDNKAAPSSSASLNAIPVPSTPSNAIAAHSTTSSQQSSVVTPHTCISSDSPDVVPVDTSKKTWNWWSWW